MGLICKSQILTNICLKQIYSKWYGQNLSSLELFKLKLEANLKMWERVQYFKVLLGLHAKKLWRSLLHVNYRLWEPPSLKSQNQTFWGHLDESLPWDRRMGSDTFHSSSLALESMESQHEFIAHLKKAVAGDTKDLKNTWFLSFQGIWNSVGGIRH